jgi:AcrR family transcriptional regulator
MNVNHSSPKINQPAQRLTKEVRREQIVMAALKMIGNVSLEKLNIAGIAQEIGLVPSAIYRHFAGKDEILAAVNAMIRLRLIGIVQRVRNENSEPLGQLEKLLMLHIELIKTNSGIPRYVFSLGGSSSYASRNKHLYQTVQLYLAKVTQIFEDGQTAGQISSELNATTLSFMFLGLIQPAVFLSQLSSGQFDIEQQTNRAWGVFRQLIILPAQSSSNDDAKRKKTNQSSKG